VCVGPSTWSDIRITIAPSIRQFIGQHHIDKGEVLGYSGISATFWFIVAFIVTLFVAVQIFYKVESKTTPASTKADVDVEGHGHVVTESPTRPLMMFGMRGKMRRRKYRVE
jgi:hypothetical protein